MVKKIFVLHCLALINLCCFSQKQTNIWYFGKKVGLNFNYQPPQPLNNSKLNMVEGSSAVADNNGKLLFYTNGRSIMNRQHQTMLNGSLLRGDLSSTNNTLIIPMPGNDSIYYVFTTGAALQEEHQFLYNIVDLKRDGSLGEVTASNILIEDIIFEKLAAVKHCNNSDVWIVVHKWDSDEYHSYLLTSAGLNPVPVISSTGRIISGFENNAIGTLKFSTKGTKLVAVHSFQNDVVELMDFNNLTGVISNPIIFSPNTIAHDPSFIGVYGAEFSPDGKLLYVSANNNATDAAVLYQFNISSNNVPVINASKQLIFKTNAWYGGALQMAPDFKIYMAMWKDSAVSVIDAPDVYGPGCNFFYNKIKVGPFGGESVQFGLPTIMQSYFDTTANPYDFTRTGNCSDHAVLFKINRQSGIDSVKWDFGDGQQSQVLSPVNIYTNAGYYNVRLIVYKTDCSGLFDTINRKIWITDNKSFLGPDTSNCSAIMVQLGITDIEGANYLWNTDSLGNSITTTGPGIYWMEIEQNGCKIRDSVNIALKAPPLVNIGNDTSLCANKRVVLNAGNSTADSYLWNTGETSQSISINSIGTYSVLVTENLCKATDTVVVFWGDCEIFMPSAFTPNNDGVNDYFGIINGLNVKSFLLQIFDRRGQSVFSTTDISKKWDGNFKKAKQPFGTYLWIMHYVNSKNEKKFLNGTVMLLR